MKMLWAIDPFLASSKAHAATFAYMKLLAKNAAQIAVAYVASPAEINLSAAFDRPAAERYSRFPLELIRKALKAAKISISPKQIAVLPEMHLSQTAAVDRLIEHAEELKSDLIVLNTHSRKGLARLVLGSFAESVIHRSEIPLLVLNPGAKPRPSIKNILYAADFEDENDPGFTKSLELAKLTRAKLYVLHCAGPMYEWPDNPRELAVARHKEFVNKRAMESARIARLAGVDAEVLIDARFEEVSKTVLRYSSSKKADLIVLKAKVGRIQALLGGSTTRKVLRAAKQPVLVLKSVKK